MMTRNQVLTRNKYLEVVFKWYRQNPQNVYTERPVMIRCGLPVALNRGLSSKGAKSSDAIFLVIFLLMTCILRTDISRLSIPKKMAIINGVRSRRDIAENGDFPLLISAAEIVPS